MPARGEIEPTPRAYRKAIKHLAKGGGKKAERAHDELLAVLSNPFHEKARRLWWGRVAWERVLSDLQEAAAISPPLGDEVLVAYSEAWVAAQADWDRWHEHFYELRDVLKGWLLADGFVPVSINLNAEKPLQEIGRAHEQLARLHKERNRGRQGDDSLERVRAGLAVNLDSTLVFDVERGDTFKERVPRSAVAWPWEQHWPHEFEGMGEKSSGEPLLGTVVRLINGTGTIRAGQHLREETSLSGSLSKEYRETWLIVCDANLVVMQWESGGKPRWGRLEAFPYDQIEIREAKLGRKGRIAAIDPGSRKPIWSVPGGLPKPVLDEFLDAKANAARRAARPDPPHQV